MTMRKIYLYDELETQFGGPYNFDVASPGEAIRALSANFKNFMPTIREGSWSLVMGDDIETGDHVTLDMVLFNLGNSDLHIMPAVEGRKNAKGFLSVILGVALIGVGIGGALLAGEGLAAGLGATTFLGFGTYGGIALMGASLLLSGISSLMTGTPKAPDTGPTTASYLLNGPEQNTSQGGAIPLIFGRFRVGSTPVSTKLRANQISVGSMNYTTSFTNAKGQNVNPVTPPDITPPGTQLPVVPDITAALTWQYPYPYYG
jgi:predicted phage tail protein